MLNQKRSKDVDGVFCILSDKIDKEFLEGAPKLKVISTMSVGFDHIDIAECRKRGVKVGNTPGVLTETTADLVLALLLSTARRIPEVHGPTHSLHTCVLLSCLCVGSESSAWWPVASLLAARAFGPNGVFLLIVHTVTIRFL